MNDKPDSELYHLIDKFQKGDAHAIWLFAQNKKIQAIIHGRLKQYRQMFHWLPDEDLEDIECGVIPRIYAIAGSFQLPEQPNDGRVISYFNLRLRGEMDYILKKVTDMKQVVDEEKGKTYLKSFSQTSEGLDEVLHDDEVFVYTLIEGIESDRQDVILQKIIDDISPVSNDKLWLRCYMLRIKGKTWAEIGKEIGYKQTDYAWLNLNTARFITRLKDKLLKMGERINYRVCGIYTDASEVSIAVIDSTDKKKNIIWSKQYDSYADLDKIEAKIGDIFRQFDITYVVMNEVTYENRAFVIIMRYLSKKESFVETVDISIFRSMLSRMPETVNGVSSSESHKNALLLAHVKRAIVEKPVS